MQKTVLPILSLLAGTALFTLGHGPLPTLLSIQMTEAGEPIWLIGLVMSQYYVGLIVGSLYGRKLIFSVGHIRAFTAFGSTMSAITLGHAFIAEPFTWGVFRFGVGVCAVGMYMCIESWLNSRAANNIRGQILSIYVIVVYLFSGIGQFLLLIPDRTGLMVYAALSIAMSLAIVPVAITRLPAPILTQPKRFSFFKLWETSPTGMMSSLIAGIITGAFYTMGPVFVQVSGFDRSTTALFISVATIGGLIFQWPIGKYSDGYDRRTILFFITLGITVTCLAMFLSATSETRLLAVAIVFGGLAATIYPLAIAYTNDYLQPEDLVPAASGLLMAYGFGAALGPQGAALVIELTNARGMFIFCCIASLITAGFIFWRMSKREAVGPENQTAYQAVPRTSAVANELNPQGRDSS